jgi:hypothetical protein
MRRPHRTAVKNVHDLAAWPSLTVIRCAVGKSPAMLAASRTAAQCRPREGPAVAFCELGESSLRCFLFGRMHRRSAFANV